MPNLFRADGGGGTPPKPPRQLQDVAAGLAVGSPGVVGGHKSRQRRQVLLTQGQRLHAGSHGRAPAHFEEQSGIRGPAKGAVSVNSGAKTGGLGQLNDGVSLVAGCRWTVCWRTKEQSSLTRSIGRWSPATHYLCEHHSTTASSVAKGPAFSFRADSLTVSPTNRAKTTGALLHLDVTSSFPFNHQHPAKVLL